MVKPRILLMSRFVERLLGARLDAYRVVRFEGEDRNAREALLRREGPGIRALLCGGAERLDEARLALLPDLELIAVAASGMSGIDLVAAQKRGIAITNAGSANAPDVADFAVTLYLAHRREILVNHLWVAEDHWIERRRPPGASIRDDRVGIVGLGRIGEGVAERLAAFGCDIGWYGRRERPDVRWPRFDSVEALSGWADTIIVTVRASGETRNLVSAEVIAALGPRGLIVNVSRGFVVDEEAMVEALRAGRLGGAALDVFAEEPARGSDWSDVPNVLLSPHVAGGTRSALDLLAAEAFGNIEALFTGRPLSGRVV